MNRIAVVSLLLLALAASPALAGRIFGDIQLDGKPLPAGVLVAITQPLATDAKTAPVADTTLTDKAGAYKLSVKDEGKCLLTVTYDKQPVTLAVFSYKEATRYDLILERKDGKLSLRRK